MPQHNDLNGCYDFMLLVKWIRVRRFLMGVSISASLKSKPCDHQFLVFLKEMLRFAFLISE